MIIFSPTKMMNIDKPKIKTKEFLFEDKTDFLVKKIQKLTKKEMANLFKINDKTLDNTYNYYNNFGTTFGNAIDVYNGISFKQIKSFDNEYLSNKVFILSALYGISNATQPICCYRLDFSHRKIFDTNLYNYWEEEIIDFINYKNEQVLDLASKEYSKMINVKKLNVDFYTVSFICSDKLTSVDLKKLRGHILNYCIENKIHDYKLLLDFKTNWISSCELKNNEFIFNVIPKSIMNNN